MLPSLAVAWLSLVSGAFVSGMPITVTSEKGTSHELVRYFKVGSLAHSAYTEDVSAADRDAVLGTSKS